MTPHLFWLHLRVFSVNSNSINHNYSTYNDAVYVTYVTAYSVWSKCAKEEFISVQFRLRLVPCSDIRSPFFSQWSFFSIWKIFLGRLQGSAFISTCELTAAILLSLATIAMALGVCNAVGQHNIQTLALRHCANCARVTPHRRDYWRLRSCRSCLVLDVDAHAWVLDEEVFKGGRWGRRATHSEARRRRHQPALRLHTVRQSDRLRDVTVATRRSA